MKKIQITIFLIASSSIVWSQNSFPLLSSGQYTGGTGDFTNIGSPQLKLEGVTTYPRIVHLSSHGTVSSVYNFQTGKNAYWGEPTDAGKYYFRGRDLIVEQGNAGIGTTTPDGRLNVVGSTGGEVKIHLANTSQTGYSVLRFSDSQTGSGKAYLHRFNSNWTHSIAMWEASSIGFYESVGSMNIGGKTAFKVFTGDYNSERMRIDVNGNVGIGTTSPNEKLAVAGRVNAIGTDTDNLIFKVEGTGGTMAFLGDGGAGSDGQLALYSSSGGALSILLQGTGNSYFNTSGNVGIGTTSPQSKLAVEGQIRATEVKVLADISVPDYVFESDYKLRTLKETKQYITKNKHLPEIPSAAEIEENGIDLGDMNMRLLKKIEELTLYQIELLERLEKAEVKITKLENK